MASKPIREFDPEDDDAIDFTDLEEVETGPSPYCEFLTGAAGTGKSYEINRRLEDDPSYALVCATTGIAAINLGENVTTINAALKYFDTDSLMDAYINGFITQRLNKLYKQGYKNIVIDEVSMMAADQLDIIMRALDQLAEYATVRKPMGLILTGDFCQLPPVKAQWAFESESWPRFEANTVRLTTSWRQANPNFQLALQAMRKGAGADGVEALASCQLEYATNNSLDFPGTTLVSKNDEVERFNWACHSKVKGQMTTAPSSRWGKQKGEWKLIPEALQVKLGSYVMILANSKFNYDEQEYQSKYEYVNGDCGYVEDFDPTSGVYHVRLRRSGRVVGVTPVTRKNEEKELTAFHQSADSGKAYYDEQRKRWIVGEVTYAPLRLAYASTVHKSQGLSLDAVQINLTNAFFGSPAMAYVALSRCRTPEGLRIVGSKELLAKRVCTDPKVIRFL